MKAPGRRRARGRLSWLCLGCTCALCLGEALLSRLPLTAAERLLTHALIMMLALFAPVFLLPVRVEQLPMRRLGGDGMLFSGLTGMCLLFPLGILGRVQLALLERLSLMGMTSALSLSGPLFAPGLLLSLLEPLLVCLYLWGVPAGLSAKHGQLFRGVFGLLCLGAQMGPLEGLLAVLTGERLLAHFGSLLSPLCLFEALFLCRYFAGIVPALPPMPALVIGLVGSLLWLFALARALGCRPRQEEAQLVLGRADEGTKRLALLSLGMLLLSVVTAEVLS